ncbi:MAG: hypothetical protein R3E35_15385 [Rhodocyclaceae bacterium]
MHRATTDSLLLDPTNIYIANDRQTPAAMSGTDFSVDGSGPAVFQTVGMPTDSLLTVGGTLQSALGNNAVIVNATAQRLPVPAGDIFSSIPFRGPRRTT